MNIKEVAKRANVSTATVSRTINRTSYVEPETAQKVWQAIEELRYYPNTHARALASGRSYILGLIVSDIVNPFFPELVKSFEDVVTEHGYDVLVTNTNYDPARMALCVRRVVERKVDGVAIMTSEIDQQLVDELERRNIPIVFLDVGTVGSRISNISVNYAQGINEAVQHLLALGHKRIGFISGPLDLQSARIRRSSFLRCLSEHRIAEDEQLIETGNHKIDGGQTAMQRMLCIENTPTAVLTSNDLTALGALRAIRSNNLRVPADISIIGFDDIEPTRYTDPPLTTVRLSRAELAGKAFDALLGTISGDVPMGGEYNIETHLIVRESTGERRQR